MGGVATADVNAAYDWLIGEDVPGAGAGGDMEDSTAFGDPGRMSDTQLYCSNACP